MGFFTTEFVNESITRIHTSYGVDTFLIQGSKRAALIDTGYGIGSLKTFVAGLTDLPLDVIITHGHVDHAGGTNEFEKVYMSHKDLDVAKEHTTVKFRKDFAKMLSGNEPDVEDILPQRVAPYTDLKDGDIFDLGDITLEIIACGGHTPGCVCVLIKEQRLLILGDACNSRSFFFFPEALKISIYYENLQRLNEREKEFDHVLFFHADNFEDKNNIEENLEVCREILAGTDDKVPAKLLGYDLFFAKKIREDDHRVDGKSANILYSKDKI